MPKALLEMIKGRWREFVREPSAFFFVMLMPILWMAILGYGFGTPHAEIYGVGWRTDSGFKARDIREALTTEPRIRLIVADEATLATSLKRGDILLIVAPAAGGLDVSYDPANKEAAHARIAVGDMIQAVAGRQDVVKLTDVSVDVPGTRYIDFLVPGLVALSIMTTSLFGTGAVIVVSRRENLLKRYLATPMSPFAYIVSHIVGRYFMLVAELATVLIAALVMFGFGVSGSMVAFVCVSALGAAVFTALAMLCGSRTTSMAVMNGMTNLITVPLMIVGGVWFARTNFPAWTWEPLRYLPLTALVDALRKIALEGVGFAGVGFEMAVLAVYLLVAAVLARVLFRWY